MKKKLLSKKQKSLETYDYNDFIVERIYPFNMRKVLREINEILKVGRGETSPYRTDFFMRKFSVIYIEITCSDKNLLTNALLQLSPYVDISKVHNNSVILAASIERWSQISFRYIVREKTEYNKPNILEQEIYSVIVKSVCNEQKILKEEGYVPYAEPEYKNYTSGNITVYYPPSNRFIDRYFFIIKKSPDNEVILNSETITHFEFSSHIVVSISILEIPTFLDILKMSGYESEVSDIIKYLVNNISFEFAKIITFYEEDNYLSNDSYYENIDEIIEE